MGNFWKGLFNRLFGRQLAQQTEEGNDEPEDYDDAEQSIAEGEVVLDMPPLEVETQPFSFLPAETVNISDINCTGHGLCGES